MRITPLDVRKQEFRKTVRGFDCDEVRAFLTTLADEYETVLVENKQVRERLIEQDDKLTEYTKMEQNLRDTLMTAERVMQEAKHSAGREGEVIVKHAETQARGILEECRLRTEELRREINALRKEKENYLARFRSLAEAQIQFIDTHQSDFEDLDRRLTDIVDTVVTRTGTPGNGSGERNTAAARQTDQMPSAAAPAYGTPGTSAASTISTGAATPWSPPAPAETSAPSRDVAANGNDIWRNYNPGQGTAAPSAPEAPMVASVESDLNGLVAEALTESAPIESMSIEAAPTEQAPVGMPPTGMAPIDTAPIESASIDSVPVDTAPIELAPLDIGRAGPDPVDQDVFFPQLQTADVMDPLEPFAAPATDTVFGSGPSTGNEMDVQAAVDLAVRGIPVPARPSPDPDSKPMSPAFGPGGDLEPVATEVTKL